MKLKLELVSCKFVLERSDEDTILSLSTVTLNTEQSVTKPNSC